MSLDFASVPLAFVAGVLGVLSPCVWPLVPVVAASASMAGRGGLAALALGLASAFAVAGTGLTWLFTGTSWDPELFRIAAALLLVVVAVPLLVQAVGDSLRGWLSRLVGNPSFGDVRSAPAQFGVGALLGVVWLPCVGPTLGAAVALASLGQALGTAAIVMLAYGVGTAAVLVVAGVASRSVLERWRPRVLRGGTVGRKVLGWSLVGLGLMVLTGVDKRLEALVAGSLPAWVIAW
ncbi:MAG: cytochrome c biogenesis protein CcdA [Gemmatimonadales bacterium]